VSVFVKICGLRSADDVAAATAAGADAVGFVFAESVRKVSPAQAKAATEAIAPDVLRVAVMCHPSNDECRAMLDEFEPDVVQTDAEDFAALDIPGHIDCWPVIREGGEKIEPPNVYVYEGAKSGSGDNVEWAQAAVIANHGLMILAGGLAEDNVRDAIRTVRPWGVDVSSGVESLPGYKDYDLVRRFIGAVRAAEKNL
jgi:phosphoribosylanthranilate isomerase